MSVAVRISEPLVRKAKSRSKSFHRSLAGQIEYWAFMGQVLEDNPDLSFAFAQDILLGIEQAKSGESVPYEFTKDKRSK